MSAKKPRVELICQQCQKVYEVKPYLINSSHFCSIACKYASQTAPRPNRRKKITVYCGQCRKELSRAPSQVGVNSFCSKQCESTYRIGKCDRPTRPIEDRFWEKIDRKGSDECWEWKGGKIRKDYGRLMLYPGKLILAHRLAYIFTYGTIPDDVLVCHHCDNPPCCNPDHLFTGSKKDNSHDAIRKGRWNPNHGKVPKGEKSHLSKLTEEQVKEIRSLLAELTGNNNLIKWRDCKFIAEKFQVSAHTIYRIWNRKIWNSITI